MTTSQIYNVLSDCSQGNRIKSAAAGSMGRKKSTIKYIIKEPSVIQSEEAPSVAIIRDDSPVEVAPDEITLQSK
jgi:hypothetical protein